MKSKLIWKIVEKNSGWEDQDTFRQYQPMLAACCDELTDYVKKNGHFNLVEVEQPEGTKVIIRVQKQHCTQLVVFIMLKTGNQHLRDVAWQKVNNGCED